mmetsp:Transcript_10806/g.14090  ORF Transcript_10806/g.14090 Transcript_10806/m.14090 type:complete len:114 (+) Transcript_10806:415-756(+)
MRGMMIHVAPTATPSSTFSRCKTGPSPLVSKAPRQQKKLLFGLSEDQEELVGISCVDVDVTDASIPQPKIVHSALNPKVGVKKSDEGKSFIAEELEKLIQEFLLTQKKVEEII